MTPPLGPAFGLLLLVHFSVCGGVALHIVEQQASLAPALRALAIGAVLGSAPFAFGVAIGVDPSLAVATCTISTWMVFGALMRPRHAPFGQAQPLRDEELRTRFGDMAQRMGLAPPDLRILGQAGPELAATAYAASIATPTLYIGEGVLHRLRPAERDAIVAHELGHFATGSLWGIAAAAPIAGCLALGVVAWTDDARTLLAGLPSWVLVRNALQRWFEVRCDLAGARAVGYRDMADALDRIHAARPIARGGISKWLLETTLTHPALAVRRAALRAAAPPSERDGILEEDTRGHHASAALVALCAVAAIGAGIAWPPYGLGVLVLVAATPSLVVHGVRSRHRVRQLRRLGRSPLRAALPPVVAVSLAILVTGPPTLAACALVVALALIGTWLLVKRSLPGHDLQAATQVALARRRFGEVLRLAGQHPSLVEGDAELALAVATAHALDGDIDAALARLQSAATRHPRAPLLRLQRAHLLSKRDPSAAAEAARALAVELPADPGPLVILANTRFAEGRLDEAAAHGEAAIVLEPTASRAWSIVARVAARRGDFHRARDLLAEGECAAPGDAFLAVARAAIALEGGDIDPLPLLAVAERAVAANPYAMLDEDVAALRGTLASVSLPAGFVSAGASGGPPSRGAAP